MIVSFADQGTEDVFNGKNSSSARKKSPNQIWNVAFRKLDQLDSAVELADLATPPGNRLERLSGNRNGSTVSELTINTEYVLFGLNQVQQMLRLLIIISGFGG